MILSYSSARHTNYNLFCISVRNVIRNVYSEYSPVFNRHLWHYSWDLKDRKTTTAYDLQEWALFRSLGGDHQGFLRWAFSIVVSFRLHFSQDLYGSTCIETYEEYKKVIISTRHGVDMLDDYGIFFW